MAIKKAASKKKAATKKRAAGAASKSTTATKKKATRKKAATKKGASKKKAAGKKKAAAAEPRRNVGPAIAKRMTRTEILQAIADATDLNRKQVSDVFMALGDLVERHVKKRGIGEFTVPFNGMKVRRVRRPSQKARMGRNPATGEAVPIAAKPARTVVKVSALKILKDKAL